MKRVLALFIAMTLLAGIGISAAEEEVFLDDSESAEEEAFSGGSETETFFDDDEIGEEDDGDDEEDENEEEPLHLPSRYHATEIKVGNPTPMNGRFFTECWGNSTSDLDVRSLVNGYNLVTWDGDLNMFRFDHSVVNGAVITDDEQDNRSYMITLYEDLRYSDGTRVTAWDYAFSLLLQCDPVIRELDGRPAVPDYLLGWEEYVSNPESPLSGVRVLSDTQMSITVKAESLPFFYELSRLSLDPVPAAVIAPGYRVRDNGAGVYLAQARTPRKRAAFNAEQLTKTILDPETGYLAHPAPVTGAYQLISFDGTTAVLEINPNYKGNEDGFKPDIRRLVYTLADNGDMMQRLADGEFALLNKVTKNQAIFDGLNLCAADVPLYQRTAYPRIGLTYFYFLPDSSDVQNLKVRQALAYCFDRQKLVQDYVGSFGLAVNGLYGLGQFPYRLCTGTMEYPVPLPEESGLSQEEYDAQIAEWEALSIDQLNPYDADPERAAALLAEAGAEHLSLKIGYPDNEENKAALEDCLGTNLKTAGVQAELIPLDIREVADIHAGKAAEMDLLYLGDNFNVAFHPALFFASETDAAQTEEDEGALSAARKTLYDMAVELNHTEPTELLAYMKKWVAFQEKVNELLPILPVYSNIYMDFFTRELMDYRIDEAVSWGNAIIPARIYEDEEVDETDDSLRAEIEGMAGGANLAGGYTFRTRDKSGKTPDAFASLPRSVREAIPAEYRTINEVLTLTLDGDLKGVSETTLNIRFATKYEAEEPLYVLLGIARDGNTKWMVQQAMGQEDGSVDVYLQADALRQAAGSPVSLILVSRTK